ncbi:MAG TPA: flagellin [Caulobacteraceae bacterium]|jgi:flagellar hook-associated protein 3 FlgL|nr:flagellin [Caulobacteraceae bacterium]
MERISTSTAYSGVLNNLMAAENQQTTIGNQISSMQMATDLQGYASHAETLTALQTLQAQVTGYLNNATITSNELTTQDTALTQLGNAASSASQAVNTAIASGNGDTLMQQLQAAFQNAVQGLNSTSNGAYVFSGGNSNTAPVSINTLTALVAAPSVASVFTNTQHVTTTQFTANLSVQTGFLANQLGTPLFTAMQQIAAYDQGPNGPFGGTLTAAQQTFLEGEVAGLSSAGTGITAATAQNGQAQSELTNSQTDLGNQQTTLQGLIGNITNVDLAQASSQLSQAQLAVQASSRVFESLQSSSLMAVLTASGH